VTKAGKQRTTARQMEDLPLIAEHTEERGDKAVNEEPVADAANRETKSHSSD
jgi:hypothetical protein